MFNFSIKRLIFNSAAFAFDQQIQFTVSTSNLPICAKSMSFCWKVVAADVGVGRVVVGLLALGGQVPTGCVRPAAACTTPSSHGEPRAQRPDETRLGVSPRSQHWWITSSQPTNVHTTKMDNNPQCAQRPDETQLGCHRCAEHRWIKTSDVHTTKMDNNPRCAQPWWITVHNDETKWQPVHNAPTGNNQVSTHPTRIRRDNLVGKPTIV